jgi:hypothetical protein
VSDLEATDTDITGGHISVGTNVSAQLTHERNAEAANLGVRLSLGVEVGTTLTTTHHEAGNGILEDLLEAQELEDRKVDGRVQAETALVGAEGRVELNTVATVDLDVALVVLPDNTELDDALRNGDDLEAFTVLRVLLEEGGLLKGGRKL